MDKTDKSTIIKAFNTVFFEFIDDILTILPENRDIYESKLTFQTIKQANPTTIIKLWFTHIYKPYQQMIDNGDLAYFIYKNYQEDVSSLKHSDKVIKIIETLRNPISNMSNTNKDICMVYIRNLSKLSEIYALKV
jgi:hypothetical protein